MTPFIKRKKAMIAKWEMDEIRKALEAAQGNKSQAARDLGMDRANLSRIFRKHFGAGEGGG